MTDDDPRLDALDHRAATAVAELDRALSDDLADAARLPTPDLEARGRRVGPLLLVAAVVVVAVLGLGLAISRFDDGDDQSTIAGEVDAVETGDFVRLTIPDPAAHGLELTAAYDGTTAAPDPAQDSTIQGPADAADPWAEAVQVFPRAVEPEPGSDVGLFGEIVDLDGVDGSFVLGPIAGLRWIHDGFLHQLHSDALDEDDLVALATSAVNAGWHGDGPLPGQQILHTATLGDTFPALPYLSPPAAFDVAAAGYRNDDVAFAIGAMPGGEDRFRSLHVFGETESVTVRGHEGVIVRNPGLGGLVGIVWRENGQTVVRVETYDDPHDVIEELDALAATDQAAFDAAIATNPLDDEHRLLEIPPEEFERSGDLDEYPPDEVLAELTAERNGREVEALLYRNDGEPAQLQFMVDDASGGASGTGMPVPDLEKVAISRSSDGTRDSYGGIAPGRIESIELEGDEPSVLDLEQVPVEGSDAVVFVALSDRESLELTTIVRIILTDGRVLRYAA